MPHLSPQAPAILCIGSATLDLVFTVPALPTEGIKYRATGFANVIGGNAATAALAVARLGGRAMLAGQIGDDAGGDTIRQSLQAACVDTTLLLARPGATSSVSSVAVDARGERLILNYTDPALSKTSLDLALPPDVAAVMGDSKWADATLGLFRQARARSIVTVLDADMPDMPAELIRLATHAAFSRPGLESFSGHAAIPDGLRAVARLGDAVAIATDGANGVYWLQQGVCEHLPAFPVIPVDTLGAGDVFHGALACALAEHQPLRAALRFASAAAAMKITRPGGAGCPTRPEIEQFLASQAV